MMKLVYSNIKKKFVYSSIKEKLVYSSIKKKLTRVIPQFQPGTNLEYTAKENV